MMIRIGFDPGLEAQQDHMTLIRENELLRISQEGISRNHSGFSTSRFLARLGREISALGTGIESRFSDTTEDLAEMNPQSSSDGCSS